MELSQTTRLTLRCLEIADHKTAIAAREDLVNYLEATGNSQDQIGHGLSYSGEMTALKG
jgi:hypothetical protein